MTKIQKKKDVKYLNFPIALLSNFTKGEISRCFSLSKIMDYGLYYNSLINYLRKKNSEVIPTQEKGLAHAKKIMFITNTNLPRLLEPQELGKLFKRKEWLFKKTITSDIFHIKVFFTNELNIPSYGMEDFCDKAPNSIFKNK